MSPLRTDDNHPGARPRGIGIWTCEKLVSLWQELDRNLGRKIFGILVVFFLVALCAIGLTLFVSWQLKGASAAINDAGSLRMRTHLIGYHIARSNDGIESAEQFSSTLSTYLEQFDLTLDTLIEGDRQRPLFIPQDRGIPAGFDALRAVWVDRLRPELYRLVTETNDEQLSQALASFEAMAPSFVSAINDLVSQMEMSFEHSTNVLQATQIMLALLAVIGTLTLVRFFEAQVIRPMEQLGEGMRKMESEDLGVRISVESGDEFGRLANGFNRAAAHLQDLYSTLEARVSSKTHSLTAKNRELEILYNVTGFLHEPSDIDTLCKGFLMRVQKTLGADASAIRLFDSRSENLCMTYYEGLNAEFVSREALLGCSQCLCSDAAEQRVSFITSLDDAVIPGSMDACRRAGFEGISASPITIAKRSSIGMFNLFFRKKDALDPSDRLMLATLGEQLGAAIDNLRLQARERELAVSEERNLLARELHDSIAQGLAFTNIQIQLLESAIKRRDMAVLESTSKMIRQGVQESYDDLRELMVHFRARVGHLDLDTAIASALKRLAEQTDLVTNFDVRGGGAPLDPETETQLLYIVQEVFSNIRKHAQAQRVTVNLHRVPEGLTVVIRDDGVGFDSEDASADDPQGHMGLEIMRERAMRIGARVTVISRPTKGTEVRLNLPRQLKEAA